MKLLSQILLALTLVATARTLRADERPNILFIYTDDHAHRTVGCYPQAYPFVKTPNIDQLASEGLRFDARGRLDLSSQQWQPRRRSVGRA